MKFNCDYCGASMQRRPSYLNRRKNHFCSREHHIKWKHKESEKRFKKICLSKVNGCNEFPGPINNWGYGVLRHNGKMKLAHRLAWELLVGKIPDNLCVLHKCDNPACINIDHLWIGSLSENTRDMYAKQRWKRKALHA